MRGTEHRPVLQDRELIRACLFTSQSTQTEVDPTADEQSAEEIKKEVRQHRVHICIPSVSHLSPSSGPQGAIWEMPTFSNAQSVVQVCRLTESTAPIKQALQCLQESNLWLELSFKRDFLINI